jgi:hypothetical protein
MRDATKLLDGPLEDFERELLRSARIDRGSQQARRRALAVFGALGVELSASAAAASAQDLFATAGSSVVTGAAPSLTLGAVAKWLGTGVALGTLSVGGAVAVREVSHDALPPRPSVTERAAPLAVPAREYEPPAVAAPHEGSVRAKPAEARALVAEPDAPTRPQVPASSSGAFPLDAPPSLLSEELALLEAVRRLLRSGSARAALDEIARYEARFPSGALAKEATLLAVEARLASGDHVGARRIAERVFAVDARSPHAERLRALLSAKEKP